jgi:CheY-like chemotaxis protein
MNVLLEETIGMPAPIANRVGVLRERMFGLEPAPEAPRTVLVVDDEEGVRSFINRVLETVGYATRVAESGPQALQVAAAMPTLDMIVTDVMMPEMSGCELARRLRRGNPALKVLYVTGYRDRLFDEKVMLWDAEAFIDKPCSIKALLEAVSLLWCDRLDGVGTTAAVEVSINSPKPLRSKLPLGWGRRSSR